MALMITNGRADVHTCADQKEKPSDRSLPQYRLIRFRTHSCRSWILGQLLIKEIFRPNIVEPNPLDQGKQAKQYLVRKLRMVGLEENEILELICTWSGLTNNVSV